jgi:hypothetical protein
MLPKGKFVVKQFIEMWSDGALKWSYGFGTVLEVDNNSSRESSLD